MFDRRLVQNAAALWVVQGFRKTLPLIILPFVARTLGPAAWGLLAIFQSFAATLILFIEFGFGLSATRQVARCRLEGDRPSSTERLAGIFASVFAAQLLLIALAATSAVLASRWIPVLRENSLLLAIAIAWGFAEACYPTWYFLGMERMRILALLEIASKSIAAVIIFCAVRSPRDVWLVLAAQGLAPALSFAAALCLVYRDIPFRFPCWSLVKEGLRAAWPMFLIRSAESLYSIGNAFLLSFFAGPAVVAFFAGPEKIGRAVSGLFNPIRETLYPRLSKLMFTAPEKAAWLARVGMLISCLGGLAIAVVMFVSAPLVVRILFGPEFQPAVSVLRVLSMLPVLIAISQSFGIQWLLPLGKERLVSRVMLTAGLLNVLLSFLFVPKFAHLGMACAVVCAEAFVCLSLAGAGALDRAHPFPFFGRDARVSPVAAPEYEPEPNSF